MDQDNIKMFVDTTTQDSDIFHEERLSKYLENAKKFDLFFLIVAIGIVIFYKLTHKYKTDVSMIEDEVDENEKTYKKALVKGEFHKYPLLSKTEITKETAIYRFSLPSDSYVLGLPIGQHISIRANIDEKKFLRSYTPISLDYDAIGYFDLLIKAYPTGNISKMIGDLQIGDNIEVCGPAGAYDYTPNCRKKLGMVAGGTGITPMYQIMKAIVDDPNDTTEVSLIYGNSSESEILLKDELDSLCERKPEQIKVYYLIDKADRDDWEGGIGYVTSDLLNEKIASPDDDNVQLLLCGPPRMVSSVKRMAVAMGYTKGKPVSKMEDQIFVF
ncbi:similar to Saccharomyces cerevisiae YIL043C CBR1 Microsomal cytochrome b reductase, not essential for viability [Maudiozyma saulgeensis]|uniref:NADH-cytochrome b5 reductase n=1 Tax=Maudiozyma saulgeensis TaxID=1789683 RepID=A0A1X7R8C2_9SACH|nr:similar to Saccharomyces cerevisiae YIL043C CBR1 Microsomal cytochrome b reductase, not essential for viability [Kazachstania saulgeensis]